MLHAVATRLTRRFRIPVHRLPKSSPCAPSTAERRWTISHRSTTPVNCGSSEAERMADGTQHLTERDVPPCGCSILGEASASTCYCGVEDLLRIIRRRYSLAVMNAIHTQSKPRYHDVAAALPGISSSTLAETLRALEAVHLLRRLTGDDASPFPTYGLTDSGVKLLSRLRQLLIEL